MAAKLVRHADWCDAVVRIFVVHLVENNVEKLIDERLIMIVVTAQR